MLVLFTIGVIIAEKAVRIAWKKLKEWNLKRRIPTRSIEAEFRTEDLNEIMVRVKDWNFVEGCRPLCVYCGEDGQPCVRTRRNHQCHSCLTCAVKWTTEYKFPRI